MSKDAISHLPGFTDDMTAKLFDLGVGFLDSFHCDALLESAGSILLSFIDKGHSTFGDHPQKFEMQLVEYILRLTHGTHEIPLGEVSQADLSN
ncbi:MAG TPA: hypothetical protein DCY38_03620 [Opitutae bacterium]|nr:hypothetical protein [Opitutae bacterium]